MAELTFRVELPPAFDVVVPYVELVGAASTVLGSMEYSNCAWV